MHSKRLVTLAVLAAVGAVLLSACDPINVSVNSNPSPESVVPYDAEAVAGDDVTFVDGLALDNKVAAGTGDLAGPDASPEAKAKWVQVAAGRRPS
ncbi:hypothetical protein [Umezawaea sp. Da 62-37]|uniref:hypothetical protein n=1 Tax=Umezawaea sp. Da 62-37 TaxID=3075927 RepID=UPI0028F6EF7C|nr:hypothetical protein [Umezawaea sp. Da 62-37]WNV88046.1 hypothetical protein RM788_07090 [Umezawaea sp. Da 62-37]